MTLNGWKKLFALLLLVAVAAIASPAQTLTTLANFDKTNGSGPMAALVQGLDGNFFGSTFSGGGPDCGLSVPCGALFEASHGGTLTALLPFTLSGYPYAGLVLASDGNFYGTSFGGSAECESQSACGTVFKVTPGGKFTVIYGFCSKSGCPDGSYPNASLIQGTDGELYGTTWSGGTNNGGTVFKITSAGKLTTIYRFCAVLTCPDGTEPFAQLVQGTDGNFYGTTTSGGAHFGGTVFKVTPTGKMTTLYSFCSQISLQGTCTDGSFPRAELVQAADGNFYGTTVDGGDDNCGFGDKLGCGTVFKITPAGELTTLYAFCSQGDCSEGNSPEAGLIQGTDGALYGTAAYGGFFSPLCVGNPPGCGTAFKITTAGALTTLYTFCSQTNCADGAVPVGGLMQATDGNIYGTTAGGGDTSNSCLSTGCGTVFRLSTGLDPFVSLPQDVGKVGHTGIILGQGLTGTTGVFVNGAPASFTVVSDTYIQATVPTGATTGFVMVETPSGTLRSNVPFQVIP